MLNNIGHRRCHYCRGRVSVDNFALSPKIPPERGGSFAFHNLVVTCGDDQGLKIVDSSEYYIHYLPKDVFYSMFTGMTVVIVPNDYHYTVPAS